MIFDVMNLPQKCNFICVCHKIILSLHPKKHMNMPQELKMV